MQFKLKEFFLFCLIIKINTDNILDDNEEISSNLHLDNSYFNQNLIRETKFSFLEQNLRKTILDYDDEDFINIFLPCPCTSETINVYLLLQEELKKARARVEDLEEQIRMKYKLEK